MATPPLTRNSALLALLLLVPAPSVGVLFAGYWFQGTAPGQVVFIASKAWLLLLPVVWLVLVDKRRPVLPPVVKRGMGWAVGTGAVIFVLIELGYFLLGRRLIDPSVVREQVVKAGLSTPMIYLLGTIYWCTLNSLLEEYVWRWFVYTRCEALIPADAHAEAHGVRPWASGRLRVWLAASASAVFFTIHHLLALLLYFDLPVAVLAAAGVFVGGATWSWLYGWSRNIYAAYVSHVFADLIIFYIGYQLVFGN